MTTLRQTEVLTAGGGPCGLVRTLGAPAPFQQLLAYCGGRPGSTRPCARADK